MEYDIKHIPEEHRFATQVDGETALVEYALYENYLNIIHTLVPRPIEGRGIASKLVQAAYDYALENGLRPQATCSYAVMWLRRHPEYLD